MTALLLRRPWLGPLLMALFGFAGSVALSASLGIPVPAVHDEFSYLLGADTLASGRLANPMHPMWKSFETFHVCVRPAYASMYPPAQSLSLAVGQLLSHPVIGVWLGMAALGAAAYWALVGFLGPPWALVGTALLIFRLCTVEFLGTLAYWAHSYWGGAVAATGGALFLGGIHRVTRSWARGDAILAAVGLGILANSRPYEGFIMSLPGVAAFVWMALSRRYAPFRYVLVKSVAPAAAVLAIVLAIMGYYNFRTTGNPLTMARAACYRQYAETPSFLFGSVRGPLLFNHRVHAQWNLIDRALWQGHRTLSGFVTLTEDKLRSAWTFFLGGFLSLPLLALPWVVRSSPGVALSLATIGFLLAGYLPVAFGQVHYMAPVSAALYLLVAAGARKIASVRLGTARLGRWLVAAWLGLVATDGTGKFLQYRDAANDLNHGFQYERERLIEDLTRAGGKHLVIVRYTEEHADYHGGMDVVYNRASIDASPVVFAREVMDCPASLCGEERTRGSENARLLAYFRDRKAWLYEADEYRLTPYEGR